jgi:hypothetical protein
MDEKDLKVLKDFSYIRQAIKKKKKKKKKKSKST